MRTPLTAYDEANRLRRDRSLFDDVVATACNWCTGGCCNRRRLPRALKQSLGADCRIWLQCKDTSPATALVCHMLVPSSAPCPPQDSITEPKKAPTHASAPRDSPTSTTTCRHTCLSLSPQPSTAPRVRQVPHTELSSSSLRLPSNFSPQGASCVSPSRSSAASWSAPPPLRHAPPQR
eukprot:scaffold117875_cov60-Phaeocystis_antarctica.AAC.2